MPQASRLLCSPVFTLPTSSPKLDAVTEGTFGEPGFKRAEHVIFEGADDLPDGKYGTSQRYKWAKDKDRGMMLAWAMNGQVSNQASHDSLLLLLPSTAPVGGTSAHLKDDDSHLNPTMDIL